VIVVSDTSTICYLLLIDRIDILSILYQTITIPQAVADELTASESPPIVQSWIDRPPNWLNIEAPETTQDHGLETLDLGEREAILLSEQLRAELVILDDKAARKIARERGLNIIGLLGIIKDAASRGLLDLEITFQQLQNAGFWVSPSLLDSLLRNGEIER